MSTRHQLLHLLADGAFHSGTDLGERLDVSRAAVNKAIQTLVGQGIEIHRVSGRGYRLDEPFIPLSAQLICAALTTNVEVEVVEEADSTSLQLLMGMGTQPGPRALLAETQTAGRGRRGRGWVATPFHNITLSIARRLDCAPAELAGLSLAAGVAVVRALQKYGVRGAGLKWPNDILIDGRKLAGLLVDVRGEATGPTLVVIGLGLNVYLSARDAGLIDQPCVSLRDQLPGPVDRNRLAALLIDHVSGALDEFARTGFGTFRAEWEGCHLFAGQEVVMHAPSQALHGVALGVDDHGALRIRDAHGAVHTFYSGEVSLRAARVSRT